MPFARHSERGPRVPALRPFCAGWAHGRALSQRKSIHAKLGRWTEPAWTHTKAAAESRE